MAKFKFKLQSLLNVKTQLENNLKNILAKEIAELLRQEDILYEFENDKQNLIELINTASQIGVTVDTLKKYNGYLSFLNQKITNQKEQVNIQHGIVDKYRGKLVKAMQERKTFEKLREKTLEQYLKDEQYAAQKAVEQVISYRGNPNIK